ncbi:non-ribosomal peptide synthetase [Wukongibacter sp. M2B1]|uniref:non-ribosomal peptide synthetase n=1 Tax=Wukongibacter sp. M2B1 TaxID=3088895 RepID=UPI003D79CF61
MGLSKKLDRNNVEDIQTLTPLQEGMLFHYLRSKESRQYLEQMCLNLSGIIDIKNIKETFSFLQRENEILRSVFRWENMERPVQIILKEHPLEFCEYDLTAIPLNKIEDKLEEIKENDRNENLDIEVQPFRITLCKIAEDSIEMIISFHHILYDGWSNGIIIKEFSDIYNCLCQELEPSIKIKTRYREFKRKVSEQEKGQQENYWRRYLSGFNEKTKLPRIIKKSQEILRITNHTQILSEEVTKKLRGFSREQEITIAELLYGVWGVILCRYSNSRDVVFGTTVSGRTPDIEGIEEMVGLFINTIPLRVTIDNDEDVIDYLRKLNINIREREEYENTSLVDIRKYSEINTRKVLFDSIVVIENYPVDKRINAEDSNIKIILKNMWEMTSYDFTLRIIMLEEKIELNFSYNSDVFESCIIERMAEHFIKVLNGLSESLYSKVMDIQMLSEREEKQILLDFNNTDIKYENEKKTIHQMFEEQVEKAPEEVAIIFGKQNLTYREVNERANRLARVLRKRGIGPDNIVGLIAERSLEMVIGIMGILKAGGAYLPIDPYYPESRIEYLLKDSNANVVLIQNKWLNKVTSSANIIDFEDPMIEREDASNLREASGYKNLAYLIYTSGSTGNPKGVMIEHRALVNRLNWMQRRYPIDSEDIILQKTPYTFDVSVWELIWWSIQGSKVYMLEPEGEKNPQAIIDAIKNYGITSMHFVPSMLNAFLDYLENSGESKELMSLKRVFTSGEALKTGQVKKFLKLLTKENRTKLHNLYGPTEAAIDVSYFDCNSTGTYSTIPIGKPIDNIRLYIVDRNNNLMPVGIPGELCIAGRGLARGYLNKPNLTDEKFINNPFNLRNEDIYDKIYKTGDLARWLPDGNIEFLGRMDHQIKIRGIRIELGEIESKLLQYPKVKEAVVMIKGNTEENKSLYGYIVGDEEISSDELKGYLKKNLPDYMVPTHFIQLEKMPLMVNGKIDRKALALLKARVETDTKLQQPKNSIEEKLLKIWKETLGIDSINLRDNYFDIGGNSILLIRMYNLINREYPDKVTVSDLFSYSTISELAAFIESDNEKGKIDVSPKGIYLPKEYYIHADGQKSLEGGAFEYKGDDKILTRLRRKSNQLQIDLDSILISLYMYLINQITQEEIIAIQSIGNKAREIKTISIDFTEVDELDDLFKLVNKKLMEDGKLEGFTIEDIQQGSMIKNERIGVLLSFNRGLINNKLELLRIFDIIFEISYPEESLDIYCEYDHKRLVENKIDLMFKRYIKLIKVISKQL